MKGEKQMTFSNSLRVHQVLQQLVDQKLLSGVLKQQTFMLGDKQLEMNMPLHVYNIDKNGGRLRILPSSIGVCIIDEYNDGIFLTVNTKLDTILDLKRKIARTSKMSDTNFGMVMYQRFMKTQTALMHTPLWPGSGSTTPRLEHAQPSFHMTTKVYENPEQMRLYIKEGEAYTLLFDDCSIKDSGAENNTKLYLVYNDWGAQHAQQSGVWGEGYGVNIQDYPRFYRNKKLDLQSSTASGDGKELTFVGRCSMGQTLLSAALKIQEQYDIPVESMEIYREREYSPTADEFKNGRYRNENKKVRIVKCELSEQISLRNVQLTTSSLVW